MKLKNNPTINDLEMRIWFRERNSIDLAFSMVSDIQDGYTATCSKDKLTCWIGEMEQDMKEGYTVKDYDRKQRVLKEFLEVMENLLVDNGYEVSEEIIIIT